MPELKGEKEGCLFRVGYALPARKIEAFMVPKFINYAKNRGIHFFPIDVSVPLSEQGPFDCIIHKLYDHQWNLDLEEFAVNHPNATVIDPPSAIQRLHNRISMLQPVSQLAIPHLNIPNQILLQNDAVSKLKIPNRILVENGAVSQLKIPSQSLVENGAAVPQLSKPNQTLVEEDGAVTQLNILVDENGAAISQFKIPNQVENGAVSQLNVLVENGAVPQLNIPNQTLVENGAVPDQLSMPNQTLVENGAVTQLNKPNQTLVENGAVPQLNVPNQTLVENGAVPQLISISNQILLENDAVPKLNKPNEIPFQNDDAVSLTATTGFSFPVIAKPLVADGGSKAHDMLLVFNNEGLSKGTFELQPQPLVLQQFVNHGGIIFKVYVAGDYVECVKRSSLPDFSEAAAEKMASECGGVMKFSQISSGGGGGGGGGEEVKMPAAEFVVAVAEGLRVALGLHLFNFDMIRDEKRDEYLVIDINYFPGYEKLASYEVVMTEFFLRIKESQKQKMKAING